MMDLVWDMDYHRSQDTAEMPVFTELQAEMWDLDSEADDTPMPEKFTTYQDIQSEDWDVDDEVQEVPTLHPACLEFLSDPKAQRFLDLYTIGNLLGSGGFGSVYEGVRRKDGQQVAIKHIRKDGSELYITAPGETCKLHLEVALMQMLSKPPHCQYVLQLVDWFEMDNSLLLVLERPIPCMDVYELLLSEGGTLSEVLAKMIMLQVIHLSLWSLFG
ncbi:hypothetical protein KOW79_005204 [Hemibagrus wyckioides]|uniref:non-specific serine/threonine protein kinase n=1 Tax=Hemibagrus wyckioides TaxID=337641 RepID=A0A9D3SPZ8_9TELE|nr:hypothetical protein KOW79_005204 [Hemibagrus wyckioides]